MLSLLNFLARNQYYLKTINVSLRSLYIFYRKNLNKLSIKYLLYPKPIKSDAFGQKYANVTALAITEGFQQLFRNTFAFQAIIHASF